MTMVQSRALQMAEALTGGVGFHARRRREFGFREMAPPPKPPKPEIILMGEHVNGFDHAARIASKVGYPVYCQALRGGRADSRVTCDSEFQLAAFFQKNKGCAVVIRRAWPPDWRGEALPRRFSHGI